MTPQSTADRWAAPRTGRCFHCQGVWCSQIDTGPRQCCPDCSSSSHLNPEVLAAERDAYRDALAAIVAAAGDEGCCFHSRTERDFCALAALFAAVDAAAALGETEDPEAGGAS